MHPLAKFFLFFLGSFASMSVLSFIIKFLFLSFYKSKNRTTYDRKKYTLILEKNLVYRITQTFIRLLILIIVFFLLREDKLAILGVGAGVILSSKLQMIYYLRLIKTDLSNSSTEQVSVEVED